MTYIINGLGFRGFGFSNSGFRCLATAKLPRQELDLRSSEQRFLQQEEEVQIQAATPSGLVTFS